MKSDRNIKGLKKAIERLENGQYPIHNSSWCTNTISWLYKYNPELRKDLEILADRMTNYFKGGLNND